MSGKQAAAVVVGEVDGNMSAAAVENIGFVVEGYTDSAVEENIDSEAGDIGLVVVEGIDPVV